MKVMVIGLGQIGMTSDLNLNSHEYISTHARAFHEHPAFELIAGIDGDARRREQFELEYDCPAFSALGAETEGLSPDVVAIAVPTPLHASILRQVLSLYRPRAVLCEKPLSYDLAEAREIVALCEEANCALYVNYIRRADPAVTEVKQLLNNNRGDTSIKGVAWYSKGLFNNGSHFFDLLQYWLGEMQSFQVIQSGRSWGDDPEPDLLVNFTGGTVFFLAAKEENFSYYAIELVVAGGRLRYDHGGEKIVWQGAVPSAVSPGYTVLDPDGKSIVNGLSRIQWNVVDQLKAALDGKDAAICTGREALRTIEYLTSIKNAL